MSDVSGFIPGEIILVCAAAAAWLRWIRPRRASLDRQGHGLLALLTLTLVGSSGHSPGGPTTLADSRGT